jgi:flagellar motor switch protein FliM
MAQAGFNPGLRAKIAAARGAAPGLRPRPEGMDQALIRALGKAAAPYPGLDLVARTEPPQWDIRPPDISAALPTGALVAMLDTGAEARALCAMDHGLVDALIEVQTTGRVDRQAGAARAPTRIDAALSRDFLGLFLNALAAELAGRAGVDWPLGLTHGAHLPDPKQLDLLLPDHPYHLLAAALALGGAGREGRILLAVPVLAQAQPAAPGQDPPGQADWARGWQAAVRAAPLGLAAVLMRRTLPLQRIEALKVGDLLPFDREDLTGTQLCDAQGKVLFRGRLGRAGGQRALCLTQPGALPLPPPRAAAEPDPAPPAAAPA